MAKKGKKKGGNSSANTSSSTAASISSTIRPASFDTISSMAAAKNVSPLMPRSASEKTTAEPQVSNVSAAGIYDPILVPESANTVTPLLQPKVEIVDAKDVKNATEAAVRRRRSTKSLTPEPANEDSTLQSNGSSVDRVPGSVVVPADTLPTPSCSESGEDLHDKEILSEEESSATLASPADMILEEVKMSSKNFNFLNTMSRTTDADMIDMEEVPASAMAAEEDTKKPLAMNDETEVLIDNQQTSQFEAVSTGYDIAAVATTLVEIVAEVSQDTIRLEPAPASDLTSFGKDEPINPSKQSDSMAWTVTRSAVRIAGPALSLLHGIVLKPAGRVINSLPKSIQGLLKGAAFAAASPAIIISLAIFWPFLVAYRFSPSTFKARLRDALSAVVGEFKNVVSVRSGTTEELTKLRNGTAVELSEVVVIADNVIDGAAVPLTA
ncbi:hypothetical protein HDU97_005744 [Phlyctochytrium planicorne]|nr:hypothetical protein HDU97_005744 [Phlyctochytrium planicorne]